MKIFSQLNPVDLLRVSRTTKDLRKLLLSRSSRSVWIDSLSRLQDLPPCPSDLSEPAYARLAFEPNCDASACIDV